MNDAELAFTVHNGDLKAGNGPTANPPSVNCDDALYNDCPRLGFNSLDDPAVFTPGDNDWADCDRTSGTAAFNSPLERLDHERAALLRHRQHARPEDVDPGSAVRTALQGLPDRHHVSGDVPCVENRRWAFKGVMYATLNVQGTCNNACSSGAGGPATPPSTRPEISADIQWLKDTFAAAQAVGRGRPDDHLAGRSGLRSLSGYQGATETRPEDARPLWSRAPPPPSGQQDILGERRYADRRVQEAGRHTKTATRTTS